MAMLSELLRFKISDESGASTRLKDLGIDQLEDDYPPVKHLYFSRKDKLHRLPWRGVSEFDKSGKRISVLDLNAAETVEEEGPGTDVLLRRDVLDALIIDLLGRRTTRASDLELLRDGDELRLRAVDAGLSAMLRRLTGGFYRGAKRRELFDWKYVEFLRGDPDAAESGAGYRRRIGRLSGGEIAQIADYIPYLHAAELLTLLPDDKAAAALQAMSIERQMQVIDEFNEDEAVELLSRMSPDLATDLVGRLPISRMKKLLDRMPAAQRERIIKLLQYPEDSVGGVMVNNIVSVGRRTNVKTLRESLRIDARDGGLISIIFVTESSNSDFLVGAVPIRTLIDADDKRLGEIMNPYVATLNPFESAREAAYRLVGAQLPAMPVTDADGKLLGAMTIDAAVSLTVPAGVSRSLKVFS